MRKYKEILERIKKDDSLVENVIINAYRELIREINEWENGMMCKYYEIEIEKAPSIYDVIEMYRIKKG